MLISVGLGFALAACAHSARGVTAADVLGPLYSLQPAGTNPVVSPSAHVVLVSYFATWCLPCMAQIEDLRALQEKFAPSGFTVVAVGMDLEGERVLTPFADEYRLPFPVLIADERIRSGDTAYGRISALPANYLVHTEKGVRNVYAGVVNRSELERWVAQALQP